ncbi:MAG: type VI secretion system protein TssA [Mesorhizobium amorphae]|nr:MAG: type VI secretion system protein TssA [Mesorhizobium amorphae]
MRAPITAEFPAGEDVRTSSRVELYYRLKDARSAARTEERALPAGEPFRLSPAWHEVRALCVELLETVTSDIEILAWLMEAELRLSGFGGLRDVFRLATDLVEDRFDSLHSIDNETIADKVAPLSGLNGVGGEGTLIQPIRLSPVVPGQGFFQSSLWDFQLAQRPGEETRRAALREAADDAGKEAMRAYLAVVNECLATFNALTAALDARCGPDAPASSAIRNVLEEARLAVVNLGGFEGEAAAVSGDGVEAAPEADSAAQALATEAAPARPRPIASREDAFAKLQEVADFFRRTEPQSPLAPAIDTIIARGRMNFADLLADLVQDDHARRTILITAGIKPDS